MAYDQDSRQAWITTALGRDVVVLERATCVERLSEPFLISVDVLSEKGQVDFMPHLGTRVHIGMDEWQGVARHFDGVLFEAEELDESDAGLHYRLTLRPWFSLLSQNLNSRIFQAKTAPDIVKEVLDGAGATAAHRMECSATYTTRDYCVQYRESDFAFVSRLLEEEGLHYAFEHTASGHVMVIRDDFSGNRGAEGPIDYIQPNSSGDRGARGPHLSRWTELVRPGAKKVTLRDYHFEIPDLDLTATKEAPVTGGENGPGEQAEYYDYPGGYGIFPHGKVQPSGAPFAQHRLDFLRAERRKYHGDGTVFALQCGQIFQVRDPNKQLSPRFQGKFLAVAATHVLSAESFRSGRGPGGTPYRVETEAVPWDTKWRPSPRTPRPIIAGLQTAVVVGPAGEVIHTDKYGRVKVQFPWDRLGQKNDASSCWIRASQIWADNNFGGMTIPRIGQEVLIAFMEGDPDLPVIVGRVYNAKRMPSMTLPDNKTQSTWKSQTVGASGSYPETIQPPPSSTPGFNEIRYEDKGGVEQIYLHAQRDMKAWIRFDENRKVGHDVGIEIGRDRQTKVKRHETLTVEDGDETRTVQSGSRTSVIHKLDKLTVETGDSLLGVDKGSRKTKVAKGDYEVVVSKGSVLIDAKKEILLKVGANTVRISPQGVEVNGLTIDIKAKTTLEASGLTSDFKASTVLTVTGMPVKIN